MAPGELVGERPGAVGESSSTTSTSSSGEAAKMAGTIAGRFSRSS